MNVNLTTEEIEKVIKVTGDACHTVLQERYMAFDNVRKHQDNVSL